MLDGRSAYRRVTPLLAVSAALLSTLSASSVSAYRTLSDELERELPVRHDEGELEVSLHGGPPEGVSQEELTAAIVEATAAWDLDCGSPRLVWRGESGAPRSDADGRTAITVIHEGWTELGYAAEQAAVAELRFVETEWGVEITDGDVLVNGDTIDWAAESAPDLAAVLVHELGHVLGLAHSAEPACDAALAQESLMCPDYQADAHTPRADDVAGLCAVYAAPPATCIESCGPDEACVDGACRPASMCADDCGDRTCANAGPRVGDASVRAPKARLVHRARTAPPRSA